jgi:hypothetical protein
MCIILNSQLDLPLFVQRPHFCNQALNFFHCMSLALVIRTEGANHPGGGLDPEIVGRRGR